MVSYNTSMHSSRMRTARLLTGSRGGGLHPVGGLHQGVHTGKSASRGAYIQGGCRVLEGALHLGGGQTPSPMNRQTGVKTLPCPKLRLRAVKNRLRW